MREIAGDAPPALEELTRLLRAGWTWVAAGDGDRPVAYAVAEPVDDPELPIPWLLATFLGLVHSAGQEVLAGPLSEDTAAAAMRANGAEGVPPCTRKLVRQEDGRGGSTFIRDLS